MGLVFSFFSRTHIRGGAISTRDVGGPPQKKTHSKGILIKIGPHGVLVRLQCCWYLPRESDGGAVSTRDVGSRKNKHPWRRSPMKNPTM